MWEDNEATGEGQVKESVILVCLVTLAVTGVSRGLHLTHIFFHECSRVCLSCPQTHRGRIPADLLSRQCSAAIIHPALPL